MRIFYSFLILLLVCNVAFAKRLDEMSANTSPTLTTDFIYSQDVSDTSENSHGTGKSLTIYNLLKAGNIFVDGVNVGIGTTTPTQALDVVGTVKATAFIGDGSGLSGVSGSVSDAAYSASWDGDTTTGASKNAIYDKIETISAGSGPWTDGGATSYLTTTADNVGIGTTNASVKLYVLGAGQFTSSITAGGTGSALSFSNGGVIDNANIGTINITAVDVGINTTAPRGKLDVIGNVYGTAFYGDGSNLTGISGGSGGVGIGTTGWMPYYAADGSNVVASSNIQLVGSNVGIGTSTAATKLTVNGTANATTLTEGGNAVYNSSETPGGELGGTWASPTIDDSVTVTGWDLGASTATTPGGGDNDTSIATTAYVQTEIAGISAGDGGWVDGGTNVYNTATTDNVAIGTTTPTQKLTVVGTVSATAFVGDGSGITGLSAGAWTDGGTNVYTSTTTDNVGIGTTTPNAATLEIVKNAGQPLLKMSSTASGAGDYFIVSSVGNVGIGTLSVASNIFNVKGASLFINTTGSTVTVSAINNSLTTSNIVSGTSNNSSSSLTGAAGNFQLTGASNVGNALRAVNSGNGNVFLAEDQATDPTPFLIDSVGNVGIGTTTPTQKLHVVGTVSATTFIGALTGNASTVTTNANLTGDVTSSGNTATIADSVTVTGWALGASTATTPSGGDNDTSLATTAYVQTELSGLGSGGWTDGGTNIYPTLTSDQVAIGTTTPVGTNALTVRGTIGGSGTGPIVLSDANVGIGTTTAPALLTVGSTGSFQIDTSGNTRVGIGTTTAGTIICVKSISSGTAVLGYCTGSLTNSICGTCN